MTHGRRPDFLVVGAMRCGTTYLHHLLAQHPGVFVPPEKELHWFTRRMLDKRADFAGYLELFASAPSTAVAGECTPDYLYFEAVPQLIQQHVGTPRLVVVLRDPVARAVSHYWWAVSKDREPLSLERALRAEPERLAVDFWHRNTFSYADKSRYDVQLARYLERFPREQILVVLSEDLYARPLETVRSVLEHIGADPAVTVSPDVERNAMPRPRWPRVHRLATRLQGRHRGPGSGGGAFARRVRRLSRRLPRATGPTPPLSPTARRILHDALAPHATACQELLRRPLPWPTLGGRG